MTERVKRACARIVAGESRGTAYLVGRQLAITCDHVVAGVREAAGTNAKVLLAFPDREVTASVGQADPKADWALLHLSSAVDAEPLRLATEPRSRDPWEAFGFPEIANEAGVWLTGEIQDPDAKDATGESAISLFSRQVAAGQGAPMRGFSGTPVLVDHRVIGHLKRIIGDDGLKPRAELGLTYACPASAFRNAVPKLATTAPGLPQAPRAPYHRDWHVTRQRAETSANIYLSKPGQPVLVWGAELSGKTWLTQHIVQPLIAEGAVVAHVHLNLLPAAAWDSLAALLHTIAQKLVKVVGLVAGALEQVWSQSLSLIDRLTTLVEMLLKKCPQRLVVLLDGADAVCRRLSKADARDFFGMLRGWAEDPAMVALRLIVAARVEPLFLAPSIGPSPFYNLSDPIELGRFGPEEVKTLAEKYGAEPNSEELSKMMTLLGGHPYLVRRVLFEAVTQGGSVAPLLDASHPLYADFIEGLRIRVGVGNDAQPFVNEVLAATAAGRDIAAGHKEAARRLERAGLIERVRPSNFKYRLACGLYEQLIGG